MTDYFLTTGRVKDGKLTVRNLEAMAAAVLEWLNCEVSVKIERVKAGRTNAQNAYLWAVVNRDIWEKRNNSGRSLKEDGWDIEDVHEFLKARYLPKQLAVVDGNGEVLGEHVIGGSTVKLSKDAFTEYTEKCRRFAAEIGIVIDDPDPYWREKLEIAA